jgi:rSAM/selenodomain-associated transferase 2
MISVIIPTYNEEENIKNTILSIIDYTSHEVIVVDGGSSDNTVKIARQMGVKTLKSAPGRAKQMNEGVSLSSCNVLFFLHGDSILPTDFLEQIDETLSNPKTGAGAFKLSIDLPGRGARLIEKSANLRSKYFQLPYGDQAIFLKREIFDKVGGFDDVLFMEDYLLVKKIRKFSIIKIAGSAVVTSGRRWQRLGLLKTTLINQCVIVGYLLGFSIPVLKKLYRIT